MTLFTIADYEEATGITVAVEDQEKFQWQIDMITTFIEDYVDIYFSEHDTTDRIQADGYGFIDLGEVNEVTSVKDWRSQVEAQTWDFDGTGKIFGLDANQTVDVEYTYGSDDDPPDALKNVAIQMLITKVTPPEAQDLTSYQVGDVTERYSANTTARLLDNINRDVLENFRQKEGTWVIAPRHYHADNSNTNF